MFTFWVMPLLCPNITTDYTEHTKRIVQRDGMESIAATAVKNGRDTRDQLTLKMRVLRRTGRRKRRNEKTK